MCHLSLMIGFECRADNIFLFDMAVKQEHGLFERLVVLFIFQHLAFTDHIDDEYRWAGVEDPKLMITTSHNPSSKLKQFAKVKGNSCQATVV